MCGCRLSRGGKDINLYEFNNIHLVISNIYPSSLVKRKGLWSSSDHYDIHIHPITLEYRFVKISHTSVKLF